MKAIMRLLLIAISVTLLLSGVASAVTPRMDYPNREILRPLVLPRGMAQFAVGYSWLETNQGFDCNANLGNMGVDLTESLFDIRIGAGIYDGLELQVGIPYVSRELSGGGGAAVGFGDLDAALLFEIYHQATQRPTSVVLGVRGIFTVGQSRIGNLAEQLFHPPSRGTYAVGPFFWMEEAYSRNVAFLYTFEYDFYVRGKQEYDGIIVDSDYGDILTASVEPIIQISDHFALWFTIAYKKEFRSTLKYYHQTVVEYPPAELLEERPAIEFQIGHNMDIFIGTAWRAWGKNEAGGWPVWAKLEVRF